MSSSTDLRDAASVYESRQPLKYSFDSRDGEGGALPMGIAAHERLESLSDSAAEFDKPQLKPAAPFTQEFLCGLGDVLEPEKASSSPPSLGCWQTQQQQGRATSPLLYHCNGSSSGKTESFSQPAAPERGRGRPGGTAVASHVLWQGNS